MLCLHDLATLSGGTLHLARMPQRDGVWQTVGSIQLIASSIEPGDVYWCLGDSLCDMQLAFLRGAAGVVSRKRLEPWPGRFALCVPDAAIALARVLTVAPRLAGNCFAEAPELKVLQLCGKQCIANFPLTCGRSAKGQRAPRCRQRAA